MADRVLITGGAGYVGSTLARLLLLSGYRVRVLDSLRWGGESLLGLWGLANFEFLRGDVTDPAARSTALQDVQAVVHLAAIVGDPACKAEPELAEAINLGATRSLLGESQTAGVKRFLFASTCSNYGVADPTQLAREDSPLNPVSLYARSKVAAETLLLGQGEVAATVLRLATVYGVSARMRFDLTVNEFARDAALGRKLVIYGESHWRPYVHVHDVARGFAHVLSSPAEVTTGQVFNLGSSDENYQKQGLFELLTARVPGLEADFVPIGPDPRSYKVSFDKIRNVLGFAIERRVPRGIDEIIELVRAGLVNLEDPRWSNT